MTIDITLAQSTSERHWEFDLTDAPKVHFVETGDVVPYRGQVTEETRDDTRTLIVTLTWYGEGMGASRSFVDTTDPAYAWDDWTQPLSDLPADFVAELLAACGGLTAPGGGRAAEAEPRRVSPVRHVGVRHVRPQAHGPEPVLHRPARLHEMPVHRRTDAADGPPQRQAHRVAQRRRRPDRQGALPAEPGDPMSTHTAPDHPADAVREELRFRLENVATHYRRCGETGEAPDPGFIDEELQLGTRDVIAAVNRTIEEGLLLRAAA